MKIWKLFVFIAVVSVISCRSEKKQDEVVDTVIAEVDTNINPATDSTTMAQKVVAVDVDVSNPNGILVTCDAVGKIAMGDTFADVVKKAGEKNVKTDSVFVDGKFYNTFCTKVWKGTAGEITINWQESRPPYQTIQNIIIDNPIATYVLENGLKIGSKLSLVNKLNGKPFSMYGFSGQNKGLLVSYNGGNLEAQIPCIRPVFDVKPNDLPQLIASSTKNGIESSDVYISKKIDPIVIKLIVNSKR